MVYIGDKGLLDLQIRHILQPGDLGHIASMHGKVYAEECGYGLNFESYVLRGLADFAQQYDSTKDRVWICECKNQIIGSLIAQHRDNSIQLRYFIFLSAYRGAGLGKKLMLEFVEFAKQSEFNQAYLWTTNDQEAAIGLYEKFGFTLAEEKQSAAFGKELTERKYELTLNVEK